MTYSGVLTDQQIADTDALRDDWMTVALSTDRCDRPTAETAAQAAYRAAGLTPPAGPLAGWLRGHADYIAAVQCSADSAALAFARALLRREASDA